MKKSKIIRIRDINHLRDQKLLLEEKLDIKEEELGMKLNGFKNFIQSGDIIKSLWGGSELKSDLLIHVVPLILKYKGELVKSEHFQRLKQKLNSKQLTIISVVTAGLGFFGYKYFKKN